MIIVIKYVSAFYMAKNINFIKNLKHENFNNSTPLSFLAIRPSWQKNLGGRNLREVVYFGLPI